MYVPLPTVCRKFLEILLLFLAQHWPFRQNASQRTMERVDGAPSVATGYQEPDVEWYDLDEEILHNVVNDDDEIAGLIVSPEHVFADREMHAHHWAGAMTVGDAVGYSRCLRKLAIQNFCEDVELERDIADTWLAYFLIGLSRNRSIEHLAIDEYCFSWNPIEIIYPFFKHNHNLRCIEINAYDLSEHFPSFLFALSTCKTNQLERIHLEDNNLGEIQVTTFMKALHKQRNLREIRLKDNEICRSGFVELSRLLQHPHSKIHSLEIGDRSGYYPLTDDECITILTHALVLNKTIKVLDVDGCDITAIGWRVFSAVLCSPICSLESLTLSGLNDEGATIIGDSLSKKNTLNSLNLSRIPDTCITSAGWQELLKCLRNPTCALRELDVNECSMDDAGAIVLAGSLEANSSLKILKMDFSSITATGCVEFFNRMLDSTCSLEELHLEGIDDQGAAGLVNLLASMSTLQLLKLNRCYPFTTNVWCAFARVLQNNSTVKTLDLEENNLNEDVVIGFATALARNSSLSKLRICDREITDRIWGAFDYIIDDSCVESTYFSNHTLHILEIEKLGGGIIPEELSRVLQMNSNEDKVAVARRKIIAYHFSGDFVDIQAFVAMAVPKLPHAIEWIGRDSVDLSLMYLVTRGIPELFERNTYAKFAGGKRKNPSSD
jgi:Ran GTPase-activating protein (RanGAP) involved in mRNA processing and transport